MRTVNSELTVASVTSPSARTRAISCWTFCLDVPYSSAIWSWVSQTVPPRRATARRAHDEAPNEIVDEIKGLTAFYARAADANLGVVMYVG